MYSKNILPVYIKTKADNSIIHKKIESKELFGIDPLSDDAYYNFEAGFAPFEKYYQGEREKIDLVMMNVKSDEVLSGLEVKLTALPDNTTKSLDETLWGTEIVMRPPTICFLVCSICANYNTQKGKERLRTLLRCVPQINHWEEISEVLPHYGKILSLVLSISSDMTNKQKPLILQLLLSYNLANDKAFALPGTKSHVFLKKDVIAKPRISKYEIKNIVLDASWIIEEQNSLKYSIMNLFQEDDK